MRWRKLGRVYVPDGSKWWARTHAFIPTACEYGGVLRVYFAGLDAAQIGRIGFVDLDPANPTRIVEIGQEPVLDIGALGAFDDCGVNASCVVPVGDQLYLYYIGWQRAQRVPYMLFTGLATSTDGGKSFTRFQRTPVLDRTPTEPFCRSAPFVLRDGSHFRVWYWSCREWHKESRHGAAWIHYDNEIRAALSGDGVSWVSELEACMMPDGEEYSLGRPWIIRDGPLYRMWYSIRSRTRPYYMGYAESSDGLNWMRKDQDVGLTASAQGWDSEMVAFPCVVDIHGKRLMLYNGNGNGASGFGVAELEQD